MAKNASSQKLELSWYGKDQALIPITDGKYGYAWVKPTDPRYCQTRTLVEGEYVKGVQAPKSGDVTYSERADLEPSTDNLLINGESGDVLEALTRVPELADKYVGQVKCIYIDPPFNTEKTFDAYEDNLEHSVWLTMMRDRLDHLKKLLAADGSIWVHLDDSEVHRMRVLMDEVFGTDKFIRQISWKKRSNLPNDRPLASNNDIILVYGSELAMNLRPRPEGHGGYRNTDNDPRGPWAPHPMDSNAKGGRGVDHLFYGITNPNTGVEYWPAKGRNWLYPREDIPGKIERGEIVFGRDGQSGPNKKTFVLNVRPGLTWPSLWLDDDFEKFPVNNAAEKELDALFPDVDVVFDTPKPERLLERIIHIATNPGDIVLDVFAGSGTTAAVAHKMGRRWVTCELSEDNFQTFTLPRLTKVVRGEDPGGITVTVGERVDATEDGLPDGLSPEDAQKLTSLLNKAIKENPDLKASKDIKALKASVKTRNSGDVMNWRGGGGFQVATLSPICFDYSPELDLATLTSAAFESDHLARSVAGHLGFYLTPDHPVLTGVRGRMRLYVTTSAVTPDDVPELISHLEEGESLTVAATAVHPDAAQALRKARKGSRVLHIPNDIFRVQETR